MKSSYVEIFKSNHVEDWDENSSSIVFQSSERYSLFQKMLQDPWRHLVFCPWLGFLITAQGRLTPEEIAIWLGVKF